MPSTVTVTSVRGQPILTTPSGCAVAVAPLAFAIASASSGAAMQRAPIAAVKRNVAAMQTMDRVTFTYHSWPFSRWSQ